MLTTNLPSTAPPPSREPTIAAPTTGVRKTEALTPTIATSTLTIQIDFAHNNSQKGPSGILMDIYSNEKLRKTQMGGGDDAPPNSFEDF